MKKTQSMHTVEEAATALGLSVSTLRAWVATRRIGFCRLGRAIRIPEAEIERLVERGFIPAVRR